MSSRTVEQFRQALIGKYNAQMGKQDGVTREQAEALQGSDGTPSDSNRYVTETDVGTSYISKDTLHANTLLKADTDHTPIELTVAASTIVGRAAAGGIEDLSPSDTRTVLGLATTDSPTFVTAKLTGLSNGYIPYHKTDTDGLEDSGVLWSSPTFTIGAGAADVDYILKFDGQTNDGLITWMEDEDYFKFDDDIMLPDNEAVKFGTGVDMSILYDGTVGKIDTSLVAASDLQILCGTDKTLVLTESVYDEIQFQVTAGKVPASNAPTWELMTTTCYAYAFSVNDHLDAAVTELPHWWKEGTAGDCHIHFTLKTIQNTGANRYAKFTVTFAYADINETWTETAKTAEYTIPTGTAALTHLYLDLGDLTLTNYLLGAQIQCNIKRIAATGGTEYADDVYINQVGMHLERTRLGSRTETAS